MTHRGRSAAAALPLVVLPILPPERYGAYSAGDRHRAAEDRGGAARRAAAAARRPVRLAGDGPARWRAIYNALPPEDRAKAGIFASNYGEAGAINCSGRRSGLPTRVERASDALVLGTAPEAVHDPDLPAVQPAGRQGQLHDLPGVSAQRALWNGRGEHAHLSLSWRTVRPAEGLVPLPPLELGEPHSATVFTDVPCPGAHFVDFINQLAAESITGGCGSGNYRPTAPNNRGQMAVFLVETFALQLYGP